MAWVSIDNRLGQMEKQFLPEHQAFRIISNDEQHYLHIAFHILHVEFHPASPAALFICLLLTSVGSAEMPP